RRSATTRPRVATWRLRRSPRVSPARSSLPRCSESEVSRFLREAESLHAGVELAAAQAEQLGGLGLVLAGLLERALDEGALHRLEVHPVSREVPDRGLGSGAGGWGRGWGGGGGGALRGLGVRGQS